MAARIWARRPPSNALGRLHGLKQGHTQEDNSLTRTPGDRAGGLARRRRQKSRMSPLIPDECKTQKPGIVTLDYGRLHANTRMSPPMVVLLILGIVPIIAWVCNYLYVANPAGNSSINLDPYVFARFTEYAAPPMVFGQWLAMFLLGRYRGRRHWTFIVFVMNLTPFCYIKIFIYGPTWLTFF